MTVLGYVNMLLRSARIDRFREAIEEAVQPGDRVLEVGTGLGTYAFFAARAGASEVVAVDSERIVHVAETLARSNGLGGIRFVKGKVPGPEVEGRFDVILFEDYPTNLLDQDTWDLLNHLARTHLKPGGRLVPPVARLNLALVSSTEEREASFPMDAAGDHRFGLDWSELRPLLANAGRQVHLAPGALATPPVAGPRIEMIPAPELDALRVEGSWTLEAGATVDGLLLWFDLGLGPDVWVSNRPADHPEPWGQWWLPFATPLPVEPGAEVSAKVWRERAEGGAPGWMGWRCDSGDELRSGHGFAGVPVGLDDFGGRVT